MSNSLGEVALIAALIVLNGYFAAAEIALISARRASLRAEAEHGSGGARVALALTEDPSRLLSTIQIGVTIAGFMASATAAVSLADPLSARLKELGVPWVTRLSSGLAVILVTLAISYLTIVFGELVPKRLGLHRAEAVAKRVAMPISIVATAVAPLVWILARSTDAVASLLGVSRGNVRPGVTEEEIKLLVTEQGSLLEEEKRMIHEIFELGDTIAREVMVPRVDVVAVDDSATVEEALRIFSRSGFSRLPVFQGDLDKVVGVLLLKDLVRPASARDLGAQAAEFARPPVFVPGSKRILSLLSEMQALRNHMAVVVDEYGGTAGVVTIEDIVEEIIGDVTDEFDPARRNIIEAGENEWVVDGRLQIEEAMDELGLPIPESDEYETVAGWVLMELGHIPVPGESFCLDGYTIHVQAVRRRRIVRLRVVRQTEQRERLRDRAGGEFAGDDDS